MPKYKLRVSKDIEISIAGSEDDAIDIFMERLDDFQIRFYTSDIEILSITELPDRVEKALNPIILSEGNDRWRD